VFVHACVSACPLCPFAADCSNAIFSIGGNAFPLRSARLKIPLQAFGESEYFAGSGPVSSTSLNEATNDEDPAPTLRDGSGPSPHSQVLSVKHPIGPPIPELPQRPEEGAKIPSSVRGQNAGDIFPHEPSRAQAVSDCQVGEHEVASRVGKSLPQPGDAEGLAGSSSDQKVDCTSGDGPRFMLRHVSVVGDVWESVREHRRREGFDLAKAYGLPPEVMPRNARRLDSAAHAQVPHRAYSFVTFAA
jgi:hypothetical protein